MIIGYFKINESLESLFFKIAGCMYSGSFCLENKNPICHWNILLYIVVYIFSVKRMQLLKFINKHFFAIKLQLSALRIFLKVSYFLYRNMQKKY